MMLAVRYLFADFEASTNGLDLLRGSERIEIEPKPLRLLLYLLSRAPAAASANELLEAVWAGESVTSNSLHRAVRIARTALGSDGSNVIRTVRGHGYQIGVAVERIAESDSGLVVTATDPFVGRRELIEALRRDVATALDGAARAVLLAGEPGIGKTRTLEYLCGSEFLLGVEIAWGRCLEGTGTAPLRPWLQILRQLVRARSADELRRLVGSDLPLLATVSEEFRQLQNDSARRPAYDADRERFRFLDACARLFVAIAHERPLALVVDDLHHADVLSLALWEHVAREAAQARLLLIGAYRHVAAPPNTPLEKMVAAVAHLPSAGTATTLGGLALEDVAELLAAATGYAASEEFVRRVYTQTDGNPLFVRSLAREMEPGIYDAPIPESIKVVVRDRMRRLPPIARTVLETASAIGREFELDAVAAATGLSNEICLSALDEAFRGGLVTSTDHGMTWRFVHMVLDESIYATLPPGRRSKIHVSLARAIAERWRDRPGQVAGVVAGHYQLGIASADTEEVFAAMIAAADHAERTYSFEEAVSFCEVALAALHRGSLADDLRHFETLIRLVKLHRLTGAREARMEAGRRASPSRGEWGRSRSRAPPSRCTTSSSGG